MKNNVLYLLYNNNSLYCADSMSTSAVLLSKSSLPLQATDRPSAHPPCRHRICLSHSTMTQITFNDTQFV